MIKRVTIMDFSSVDYMEVFRSICCIGIYCFWCMVAVDHMLALKENKRNKILKWGFVFIGMLFVWSILYISMDLYDEYLNDIKSVIWEKESLRNVFLSLVYVLYHMAELLIPTITVYIGSKWIYQQDASIKTFIAVLTGLFVNVISNFLCELCMFPFLKTNPELGVRVVEFYSLKIIIIMICFFICYIVFRSFISRKIKEVIHTPDGRLDEFVKIPIISSLLFAILLSILNTFGIMSIAVYWTDILIYYIVIICLSIVYTLMYWSIFKGITLSTETMKNHAELDVAKHIQTSMLPNTFPAFPERSEFDIFAYMETAKEVGGDFYDFYFIDDNHLAITIADVSGKGIPAALFMMTARTLLKNMATTRESLESVLFETNNSLCENNDVAMFVTAWIGVLEIDTGVLSFINAGHNPPLWKSDKEGYQYLDCKTYHRGLMLGAVENLNYQLNKIQMKQNDMLFLYTDGVTEALNKQLELYGEDRLKKCLNEDKNSTPKELLKRVLTSVNDFVDHEEQFDDITMLALQMKSIPEVLEINVDPNAMETVSNFVEAYLTKNKCSEKMRRQAMIVVDEIFSNIIYYSKADKAMIRCFANDQEVIIKFEDNGIAYNPLEMKKPDLTSDPKERALGGLGIYVVKEMMDEMEYSYQDGKNILTVKKTQSS